MSLEFDIRSIDDLEAQERYRAAKDRRAELDALREDRNRGYHPVGEAWRGITPQPDLDIGV